MATYEELARQYAMRESAPVDPSGQTPVMDAGMVPVAQAYANMAADPPVQNSYRMVENDPNAVGAGPAQPYQMTEGDPNAVGMSFSQVNSVPLAPAPGPTPVRAPKAAPVPHRSAGPATPRQDPYNIAGLQGQANIANAQMFQGMQNMANSEQRAGELAADRDARQADLKEGAAMADLGRVQEVDRENEVMMAYLKQKVEESEQLNNKLAEEKIDPSSFFADASIADKFAYGIAGILGGLLSVQPGMNGRNPVMDNMNALIERDIRAQEANLSNKRASLAQRDNLLGQYMKIHGDRRLAKLQTAEQIYKATSRQIEAEGERATTEIQRVNAAKAKQAIELRMSELQKEQTDRALALAEQRKKEDALARARAAAAAAHARKAAEKEAFERGVKLEELSIKRMEAQGKDPNFDKRKVIAEAEQHGAEAHATSAPLIAQMQMMDRDGKPMVDENGRPVYDKEKELPGLSPAAGWVEDINNPFTGENVFLSDQAVINRRSLDQLGLAYRNAITGAGGSDAEAAKIEHSLLGARGPAELRQAIEHAESVYQEKLAAAKAAAGPAATAEYEQNKANLGRGELPGSVRKR